MYEVADGVDGHPAAVAGHCVVKDDVAVLVPEGEIAGAQNRFRARVCRLPDAAACVRQRGVQPFDPFRLDRAAVLFQNPRLEVFERWLRL
jgi:hypothetical protein